MANSAIFEWAAQKWAEMSAAWEAHVEAEYNRALEDCSGVLVNAQGRQQMVDGYTLFTGPRTRALKYASEELLDYWSRHPRMSMGDFEYQFMLGDLQFQ